VDVIVIINRGAQKGQIEAEKRFWMLEGLESFEDAAAAKTIPQQLFDRVQMSGGGNLEHPGAVNPIKVDDASIALLQSDSHKILVNVKGVDPEAIPCWMSSWETDNFLWLFIDYGRDHSAHGRHAVTSCVPAIGNFASNLAACLGEHDKCLFVFHDIGTKEFMATTKKAFERSPNAKWLSLTNQYEVGKTHDPNEKIEVKDVLIQAHAESFMRITGLGSNDPIAGKRIHQTWRPSQILDYFTKLWAKANAY